MRLRAIICCLLYGLLPSDWYESEPHYSYYWPHLRLNLGYALRWVCFVESSSDQRFERVANPNWRAVFIAFGFGEFCGRIAWFGFYGRRK